jgi:hypothetical protein
LPGIKRPVVFLSTISLVLLEERQKMKAFIFVSIPGFHSVIFYSSFLWLSLEAFPDFLTDFLLDFLRGFLLKAFVRPAYLAFS